MSEHIKRRHAFWDNWLYNFSHIIDDIEAEQANKWVNEYDMQDMNSVISHLKEVRFITMRRFRDVLTEELS